MRKLFYLPLILSVSMFACKPTQTTETSYQSTPAPSYPEALSKVFDKHGGIDTWKKMQSMKYDIVKEAGNEHHFIQLWDRKDRVDGANFSMGYNGKDVWLKADTSYKGNAIFYHNLYFYFYAMPFVLGDAGIIYSEDPPLEFEGKSYPAVRIRFEKGVGSADLDEYILYYDPETYQMAWLAYTATYYSKERKKNFNKIRYDDWVEVNGLLLPQSLTWYKVEEGKLIEPRRKVSFANISVGEEAHADDLFAMPEGAMVAE